MEAQHLYEGIDIRDRISIFLTENDRTPGWLSKKLSVSRSHLCHVLKKNRVLTDDMLCKINAALGTNFKNETKPEQNGQGAN